MNNYLFTIITVCRNAESTIERCIRSVVTNKPKDVQYIVIDGASNDGTLEQINKYKENIDILISEKDSGIYNAMNKGIDLSKGEYVGFLNADDFLTFNHLNIYRNKMNNIDYIFSICLRVDKEENVLGLFQPIVNEKHELADPLTFGTFVPHPTLYCRREILKELRFNEDYKIAADYDFMIKLVSRNYKYKYIPKILVNFTAGGASESSNDRELFLAQLNNLPLIASLILDTYNKKKKYYAFLSESLMNDNFISEHDRIKKIQRSVKIFSIIKMGILWKKFLKRILRIE